MTLFDILVGKRDKFERINLDSQDKVPTLIILEAYQPKLSRAILVYMKPLNNYVFQGYVLENSVDKKLKEEIVSISNPKKSGYKSVEAYYWDEGNRLLEEASSLKIDSTELYSKLSDLIKKL